MTWLLLSLAGGVGAVARLLLDAWVCSLVNWRLPIGTLTINTLGSLLLGAITGLAAGDAQWVLGVGFCGAFTTFSTASVETIVLLRSRPWLALGYASITLGAALGAAWVGLALTG